MFSDPPVTGGLGDCIHVSSVSRELECVRLDRNAGNGALSYNQGRDDKIPPVIPGVETSDGVQDGGVCWGASHAL